MALFSFLAGYFEYIILLLLLIIIHECGHTLGALVLKKEVKEIIIYPFGGITKINSLLNSKILEEIIILIMGPLIQILFYLLIFYLYKNNYVPVNTFEKISTINFLLLVFNLLPILPLDGGRLLNNLFNFKISYKFSHILSIIISLITIFFIIFIMLLNSAKFLYVLIILLIIKNLIIEIKIHNILFNKFIVERILYDFNYKNGKIINNIIKLNRNKKHMIEYKNKLYTEKEYINKFYFK